MATARSFFFSFLATSVVLIWASRRRLELTGLGITALRILHHILGSRRDLKQLLLPWGLDVKWANRQGDQIAGLDLAQSASIGSTELA